LLDADEERRLGEEIAGGSIEARNRLVMGNVRLVVSIAKRHARRASELPELVAAGNLGLVIAAGRFDAAKGCKFASYAGWWIRHTIRRAGRRRILDQAVSLDAPCSATGKPLREIVTDDADVPGEAMIRDEDGAKVRRVLDGAGDRAACVVRERFGLDGEQARTREEIGGRLGVTAERVRQIENQALERLRMLMKE